jgi:ribosomal protein S18 acetylase RimI-like enzyme
VSHRLAYLPGALDPVSVIAAIETNLIEWYRALAAPIEGADVIEEADHTRVVCPSAHPACNAVLRAHLGRGQADASIRRILACFDRRASQVLWWIGPASRPVDLSRHLTAAGFEQTDTLHGMAADLAEPAPELPPTPGLRIAEVRRAEEMEAWSRPFVSAFHVTGELLGVLEPLAQLAHSDRSLLRFILVSEDGAPVSSAVLFLGPGVAGLYYIGTEPSARGRGHASALVGHALAMARGAGYRVCVLHATPMSADLYRRMGFVEYCRLRTFAWRPGTAS